MQEREELRSRRHSLRPGRNAIESSDPARGISQSRGEEIANVITHGIGAALAVAALALLVTFASIRGDAWRIVALSVYGATLFLLYLASTLYHAFRAGRIKRMLHTLDHSAIFLLIAGTYTPVTLVHLRGAWGWSLFGVIWGLAALGILAKVFFTGRFRAISTLAYVGMGWLVLVALEPVLRSVPAGLLMWIALGGVCYTLGVAFYAARRMPYHHTVWHLFVLAGSVCHFFGMLFHATAA